MQINQQSALSLVREWIAGANARDLQRVFALSSDNVAGCSSFIRTVVENHLDDLSASPSLDPIGWRHWKNAANCTSICSRSLWEPTAS